MNAAKLEWPFPLFELAILIAIAVMLAASTARAAGPNQQLELNQQEQLVACTLPTTTDTAEANSSSPQFDP